jgi:hypothetical protein
VNGVPTIVLRPTAVRWPRSIAVRLAPSAAPAAAPGAR